MLTSTFLLLFLGKLEVRLLGCDDLLKPLTEEENHSTLAESSSPTSHSTERPPGEGMFFKNI